MRSLIVTFMLAVATNGVAFTQEDDDFTPIAECISSNAPAVEKAISSLQEATDFLVGGVCAKVIQERDAAQTRAQYEYYQERQRERCEEMKAALSQGDGASDIDTATDLSYLCSEYSDDAVFEGVVVRASSVADTPDARSLAAKTLLELRTSRLDAASKGNE